MNLSDRIQEIIEQYKLWSSTDKLLVAVSGGVDSVVLLHILSNLPKAYQPKEIAIAHFNHQTRPETEAEEAGVRDMAQKLGLPIYVKKWDQGGMVDRNFEQVARQVRYNFFESVMTKHHYTHLVTGHHLDDQAETVLMRLIRGGLLSDKAGIPFKRDFADFKLVRPLLSTPKADLYAYAQEKGLTYFEDASNFEENYQRNRIRQNVLPLLQEENPQANFHLAEFASDLQDLLDFAKPYLNKLKNQVVTRQEESIHLSISSLLDLAPGTQRLLLQSVLEDVFQESGAFNKSYVPLILDWLKTSDPNSRLHLSDNWQCIRSYDSLVISQNSHEMPKSDQGPSRLELNTWTKLSKTELLGVFKPGQVNLKADDQVTVLPKEAMTFPLTARHRKNGDKMTYKGGQGHKKIKSIFINQKVPAQERDAAWLIEDGQGHILWLVGYQESQLSNAAITDKMNYIFVYRQIVMED